jgi:hypothetical protein
VSKSKSCSWCHAMNFISRERSNICRNCGHRADLPMSRCDCLQCTLPPPPLTAEQVNLALADLSLPEIPPVYVPVRDELPAALEVKGNRFTEVSVEITNGTDELTIRATDKKRSREWVTVTLNKMMLLELVAQIDRAREFEAITKAAQPEPPQAAE